MIKRLVLFTLLIASLMLAGCARAATPEAATAATTATPQTAEPPAATPTTLATSEPTMPAAPEGATSITGAVQGSGSTNYDVVPPTFDMALMLADGSSQTISLPVDAPISLPSGKVLPSVYAIQPCLTLNVTGRMEGERFMAAESRVLAIERLPVDQVVARTTGDTLDLLPNPESPVSLERLTLDTSVSVRGQCAEWLQVTTADGENGWVRAADVTPIEEPLPILAHFPASVGGGDPGMSLTPITVTARVVEATGYLIEIDEAASYAEITLSEFTPIMGVGGANATLGDIRPGAEIEVTGYDLSNQGMDILAIQIVILSLPD